ncbi:Uncharacterised protein [Klebsiella pneumoniae]|nr:Uncharacterised protein [Klebsiella pneumoniae]
MVDGIFGGERHFTVKAVNRAGGGVHQVFHLGMTAAFQNVQIPHQVSVCVGIRVFQRVAHTGLGGQVDHAIKLLCGEQLCHTFTVGQIQLLEMECRRCQAIQTGLLQADVIIVVHVVDSDNIMPFIQQALRDMEADKTCGTSDQKLHIFPPGCGYPVLHKCRFYTGLRLGSLALPRLTRQARGEGRFFWQNCGGKG